MGALESLINIQSILCGLIAVYLYIKVHSFIKLRRFKGPWLSRFSEIPHIRAFLSEECHNWYTEVSNKYGQIAVVSPKILATSSPELWARTNSHPGYTRSKWFYRPVRYDWRMDNVFTQVDTKKHDLRRKQMLPGYSGRENLTLESDIDACLRQFVQLVQSGYARPGKRMDLAQKVHFLTLDSISTIGFDQCFGLLDQDADPNSYTTSTMEGLRAINRQMALGTWWTNWIPLVGPKMDVDVATSKGFEKMLALSGSMLEARERAFHEEEKNIGVVEKADMLTSFMKNGIAGAELKTEVILQIVAGSDTTAAAIRGTMLYVLTNPRVYKVLQSEIDEAVAAGWASPAPDIISHAQAKRLPYLQAVIKEGIRIFPPVTDPLGRDTPPGGDTVTIDGEEVFLPGGISVFPSFVAMHRDKRIFGEDADVFRPERWLDESDRARLDAMKRVHDLEFAHARYLCLGKSIAMMELSKVLFELLRHFDWGLVNPEKPWKNANYTGLRAITDLWVQVQERPLVA